MRRFLFASLGVAFMLGYAPHAPAQGEVTAIIEKAVKAHGGAEKLDKVKCLQTKGKGKLELRDGIEMTQDKIVKFPNKFKEVLELEVGGQNMKIVTVFDGTKAAITRNGEAVDINDMLMEEFKEAAHGQQVGRLTNLLKDKSLQLTLLGESKAEDRPVVGVKVASKGHRDISLYFDKESGLLAKVQTRRNDPQSMQEVDEERFIKEYQDFDGQKVAKKILVNRDGKKYLELDITEVKHLDDVPDNTFQQP
jgi:hypothetical protein